MTVGSNPTGNTKMEFTVISQDMNVDDVKPEGSIKKYFQLVDSDMKIFFSSPSKWSRRACPACEKNQPISNFEKMMVPYSRCGSCYTIYSTLCPAQNEIDAFYQNGEARKYWAEELWAKTEQARIDKVINPIIDWIDSFTVSKFSIQSMQFAEVGSIHSGLLVRWSSLGRNTAAVAPHYSAGDSQNKSIAVYSYEDSKKFNVLHLPNTLDRSEDPLKVLEWCHSHLADDGLCFLTGILSTGLDSLTLDDKLETLLPPDRLNCFSYEGLRELIEKSGFEIIEYSTPGELDLDIIRRNLDSLPMSGLKTFFKYIFEKRNDENLSFEFKRFLQMNRLSSRARLVFKKR